MNTPVPTAPNDVGTAPPETLRGRLRYAGPGIIISGSIVGSGELIVTTKLGAEAGFVALWLILFSCFIKVFLQIELGRYVVATGDSVLEALDKMPGPRYTGRRIRVNWLNSLWSIMAFCSIVQMGGILTGLVAVFALPVLALQSVPPFLWPLGFAVFTAGLLVAGRYRLVERASIVLVCLFTAITVTAVVCLQGTESAILGSELASGLKPSFSATGLTVAFAALGITGVGASELIYYPYWCLEKGYARATGRPDGSAEWEARARGWIRVMQLDAWLSCALYTVGTVAFYLLGAAVLHRRGIVPENENLHDALARMYTVSLGETSGTWLYAIGAFAVLFSTFFVATASNSRVVADAVHVFHVFRFTSEKARATAIRILCVCIPLFCWAMTVTIEKSVVLILVGGVAQATLLPFLALAIVYLRYRYTPRSIAPFSWVDPFLWLALVSTFAIGVYQVYRRILN